MADIGTSQKRNGKTTRTKSIKIAALTPYANNARVHSEKQIDQIAASITEFGFTVPVLIDQDRGIIAGHGRALAAAKLGMDAVPCIEIGWLTEAQKKAYIIADNRLTENSGWDDDLLRVEFETLRDMDFDLSLSGFSPDEIDDLFFDGNFGPGSESDQGKLDEKTKIKCPECGCEF